MRTRRQRVMYWVKLIAVFFIGCALQDWLVIIMLQHITVHAAIVHP